MTCKLKYDKKNVNVLGQVLEGRCCDMFENTYHVEHHCLLHMHYLGHWYQLEYVFKPAYCDC